MQAHREHNKNSRKETYTRCEKILERDYDAAQRFERLRCGLAIYLVHMKLLCSYRRR